MTEDDERLDRAKRIRKMREGTDRGTDEDGDSQAAAETGDGTADGSADPADDRNGATESENKAGDGQEQTADDRNGATGKEHETDGEDETADETQPTPEVPMPETDESEPDETAPSPETGERINAPLPDSEQLEQALEAGETEDSAEDDTAAATPSEVLDDETSQSEETRVLEFRLGAEYYCLEIEYIEEIVKEEAVTRVPNTPEYVEGVVDLRGQITTILNPKVTIGKEDVTPGELIVVFDSESFEDQGHIGWVVDDVRQVSPITDGDVDEAPVEEEYVNGVIDREDDEEFVIWTEPDMAMDTAE